MRHLLVMLGLALAAVLASAQDGSGEVPGDVLADLRDQGRGFAQVLPGGQLSFPRDHGSHPDYRIEWWYLTANLQDGEGRHWGIQWTLFRQALSPRPVTEGWRSNQVWMGHAAITTPQGHFHEQRFSRGGIGQAGVTRIDQGDNFNAWIDDWEWRSNSRDLFPATLRFNVDDYEVILMLESSRGPVANGVDGYSQKSAQGQASYYYSQPQIRVRGFVNRGLEKVYLRGQGWLDREWSSQPLAPNQQGWDWFSLHLDDGHKLMVYQLRHDDGQHWLSGNWIDPNGVSSPLGQDSIRLTSTRTGDIDIGNDQSRELPLDWQLSLVDQQRSWKIRPLYDQQWMQTLIPYWEGVVLVESADGKPAGVGYMELTGYQ